MNNGRMIFAGFCVMAFVSLLVSSIYVCRYKKSDSRYISELQFLPLSRKWGEEMSSGFNSLEADIIGGTFDDIKHELKEHNRLSGKEVSCFTRAYEFGQFLLIQSWYGPSDVNNHDVRVRIYKTSFYCNTRYFRTLFSVFEDVSLCYNGNDSQYVKIFDASFRAVTSFAVAHKDSQLIFLISGFFLCGKELICILDILN